MFVIFWENSHVWLSVKLENVFKLTSLVKVRFLNIRGPVGMLVFFNLQLINKVMYKRKFIYPGLSSKLQRGKKKQRPVSVIIDSLFWNWQTWISNRRRKYRLMGIEIPPPKGGPAVFTASSPGIRSTGELSPDEESFRMAESREDLNDGDSVSLSEGRMSNENTHWSTAGCAVSPSLPCCGSRWHHRLTAQRQRGGHRWIYCCSNSW